MPKWARKSQNAQIFLNLLLAVSLSIQVFDRVCLFMEEQFVLVEEKKNPRKKYLQPRIIKFTMFFIELSAINLKSYCPLLVRFV